MTKCIQSWPWTMTAAFLWISFCCSAAHTADTKSGIAIGVGYEDGHVLLSELNCTSCHQSDDNAAGQLATRQAPILTKVGARVTPQYLKAFLAAPHELKPGTPMPDVLHGLPAGERAAAQDALVHYLVSLGGPIDQRASGASLVQIERGKALFHSVGCVACHKPFEPPPTHKIDPLAADAEIEIDEDTGLPKKKSIGTPDQPAWPSIPHGDLASKTTVDSLAEFLDDPLAVRPSGRMPAMSLAAGEARMLAAYLLRDQYNDKESAPGIGLDFALYEGGTIGNAADLGNLEPSVEGEAKKLELAAIQLDGRALPKSNFGVRFHGLIEVPTDGNYRFWTKSDDGTVLRINEKIVVNNDGHHPPQEKDGSIDLRKGRHAFELNFTQGGGGFELAAYWQPPGAKKREPIPPGVLLHSAAAMIPKGITDFAVDPAKAARGRELFVSIGCASCHENGEGAIRDIIKSRPLAALDVNAKDSCLNDNVGRGRPKFALSDAQRASIKSALSERKQDSSKQLSADVLVDRTMTTLNCYACHQRNDKGGPSAAREDYFTYEVVVDLGEEGRLPPPLNYVGAKLTDAGFDDMLFGGQRYRTYMATRMPQYGKTNIGHFPNVLAKADAGKTPQHQQEFSGRMVDDGRRLVGKDMLSCINCHEWGDLKMPGVDGMDLLRVSRRIQPSWFRAWLKDPLVLKPNTRMPRSWPDGKSYFPDIQGGDMHSQIDAIWAYLSVGEKGGTPPGLSPDDKSLLTPNDKPIVFRTFLDGVSAHAILVGFRQRTHAAFDANRIKTAVAWTGDFITTKPVWDGRAGQYAKIPGADVIRFPDGPAFARLGSLSDPWPAEAPKAKLGSRRTPEGWQFRGYRFDKDRIPTFLYRIDSIDVEETLNTEFNRDAAVINRTLELRAADDVKDLYFLAARGREIVREGSQYVVDDRLRYQIAGLDATIRETEAGKELIVPVRFKSNSPRQANLEIKLSW